MQLVSENDAKMLSIEKFIECMVNSHDIKKCLKTNACDKIFKYAKLHAIQ